MDHKAELILQRNEAYRQMEEYSEKRQELDGKIERLKEAKKALSKHKNTALFMRVGQAELMFADNWQGKRYSEYQDKVREGLTQQYNHFYDQLDSAHDEVNDELMRLQNECDDLLGWVGDIKSSIRYLSTAIYNAFN